LRLGRINPGKIHATPINVVKINPPSVGPQPCDSKIYIIIYINTRYIDPITSITLILPSYYVENFTDLLFD